MQISSEIINLTTLTKILVYPTGFWVESVCLKIKSYFVLLTEHVKMLWAAIYYILSVWFLIDVSVLVSIINGVPGYFRFCEIRSMTHDDDRRASASWSQHSSIVSHIAFKPCKMQIQEIQIFLSPIIKNCGFIGETLQLLTLCTLQCSNICGRSFFITTFSCISSRVGWTPS